MAFFSVPTNPTEADVADAFSLAAMAGLMARGQVGGAQRVSLEEAFKSIQRYGTEVARASRNWTLDNQELGGSPEEVGERLRAATVLASAVITGLVTRRTAPDQAFLQVSRLREKLMPVARSLSREPDPEPAAVLVGGVLQGEITTGTEPTEALAKIQGVRRELSAAASSLSQINRSQFGEDGSAERLTAVAHIYATALAGLVGRGQRLDDALLSVRNERGAIFAQTAELVPTKNPEALAQPAVPGVGQWRQRGPDAPAEPSVAPLSPSSPGLK